MAAAPSSGWAPASTCKPYSGLWPVAGGCSKGNGHRYGGDVALPKVYGIETEYGIRHTGVADPNPISASSVLINAYLNDLARRAEGGAPTERVGWDFEDEHPGSDARGFSREGALPPEIETHLVNAVLTNGARYYVDHAHPECSTPECADPRSIVVYDRAAEEIVRRSMVCLLYTSPSPRDS